MAERMIELTYKPEDGLTVRLQGPQLGALFPKATREHLRTANKELLLALRGLVDGAIEMMESPQKGKASKTRIKVE